MRQPIEPGFSGRWQALWCETGAELFAAQVAAQFVAKAGRIGEILKLGLFYRPDRLRIRPA